MKKSNILLIVVFCAFVVRILLAFYSLQYRENTDVIRYKDWARIAYLHSLGDTYTQKYLTFGTLPNNQPPGSLYVITAFYNIHILFAKIILRVLPHTPELFAWLNGPSLNMMLRLPAILSDCFIGIGVWFYFKYKKLRNYGFLATLIILFNPVFIYNSAIWGQMDSIVTFLFLLSVYFVDRRKIAWSMVLATLSLYVKISAIYMLPLLCIFWWKYKKNIHTLLYGVIICVFLGVVLVLPISQHPLQWIYFFLTHDATGEMTNITIFAMNFWWMIFRPAISIGNPFDPFSFTIVQLLNAPSSSVLFFGVSLFNLGIILFTLFAAVISVPYLRRKNNTPRQFVQMLSLVALMSFLFLPQMHERYIYLALVLLGISTGFEMVFLPYYLILVFCNLINIYIVWHPMKLLFFPYELWTRVQFQWIISLIIVIAVGHLFIKFLHENYKKV